MLPYVPKRIRYHGRGRNGSRRSSVAVAAGHDPLTTHASAVPLGTHLMEDIVHAPQVLILRVPTIP